MISAKGEEGDGRRDSGSDAQEQAVRQAGRGRVVGTSGRVGIVAGLVRCPRDHAFPSAVRSNEVLDDVGREVADQPVRAGGDERRTVTLTHSLCS